MACLPECSQTGEDLPENLSEQTRVRGWLLIGDPGRTPGNMTTVIKGLKIVLVNPYIIRIRIFATTSIEINE
ncbi:MAG TPA: hypothetical protein VEZ17_10765 [Chitinophagaceae bacterium]|nr:hypothetical protein [Chitinophagaceae bacterium]